MITLIVLGIAVTLVVVLFAAVLARNAPRRENRFAASELGAVPWIDAEAATATEVPPATPAAVTAVAAAEEINESSLIAASFVRSHHKDKAALFHALHVTSQQERAGCVYRSMHEHRG
jgi:hypothetical protein